ncbi:GTP binding domain [Dillenia turbinata]|uniref:GTP binding domain n=1 Tax=Dillenia turbinata TaxID=194707 RepID=A0AAN8VC19_9MAGN
MATASFARRLGSAIKKAVKNKGSAWLSPHMVAASRAISERIPLVDLILEVRDARIPLASGYEQLRYFPSSSSRRIIVLNKADLADRIQTQEWMEYFEKQNSISYAVNSHNKESVKKFLNFLQAQARALKKSYPCGFMVTIMLVGIPNVGKSALANSLQQVGRIGAAEKGKLKHAVVSPHPGETKNISSLKIGSNPNVYILDTPGILPSENLDIEDCSKLALTGAIMDNLVGEEELAPYFLSILNMSNEFKKWEKLSASQNDDLYAEDQANCSSRSGSEPRLKKQYTTDHTQDFIVHEVRRTLFNKISTFGGNLEDENDMLRLIDAQTMALKEAFHVPAESDEKVFSKVSTKLVNLYRTGRLGHYTLDPIPRKE